jgi:deglycase
MSQQRASVAYGSRMEAAMADVNLDGLRVAILATDGFEQVELTEPRKALERAGAITQVVSPESGRIRSWRHGEWGDSIPVDVPLEAARVEDFDALVLPGGVMNPDKLRTVSEAVALVRAFFEQNKPVAAICHGPWMLLEAGVVRGRRLASWPSLRTDLHNAGAQWFDREVVVDGNLVTSRKPDDLAAFNEEMLTLFDRAAATTG